MDKDARLWTQAEMDKDAGTRTQAGMHKEAGLIQNKLDQTEQNDGAQITGPETTDTSPFVRLGNDTDSSPLSQGQLVDTFFRTTILPKLTELLTEDQAIDFQDNNGYFSKAWMLAMPGTRHGFNSDLSPDDIQMGITHKLLLFKDMDTCPKTFCTDKLQRFSAHHPETCKLNSKQGNANYRHKKVNHIVIAFARKAGFQVDHEPLVVNHSTKRADNRTTPTVSSKGTLKTTTYGDISIRVILCKSNETTLTKAKENFLTKMNDNKEIDAEDITAPTPTMVPEMAYEQIQACLQQAANSKMAMYTKAYRQKDDPVKSTGPPITQMTISSGGQILESFRTWIRSVSKNSNLTTDLKRKVSLQLLRTRTNQYLMGRAYYYKT